MATGPFPGFDFVGGAEFIIVGIFFGVVLAVAIRRILNSRPYKETRNRPVGS